MPITTKETLVKQVATFQAEILKESEDGSLIHVISMLAYASEEGDIDAEVLPGQLVSRHFFGSDHYNYAVARGPFDTSRKWLESYMH